MQHVLARPTFSSANELTAPEAIEQQFEATIAQMCAALGWPVPEGEKKRAAARLVATVAMEIVASPTLPTTLPEVAPELYADRPMVEGRRETIPGFLRRVWKPWIDAELLTRADLRRLDPQAEKAIDNWTSRSGALPKDVQLPMFVRVLSKSVPKKTPDALANG